MPMLVFIRQILRVSADGRTAGLTGVSKERLVALDTERFLVPQYVPVASQVEVTVEAGENCR